MEPSERPAVRGNGGPDPPEDAARGRDVDEQHTAARRSTASGRALRAVFERSPVGMALVRQEPGGTRRVLLANDAIAHLLGASEDSLSGAELDDFLGRDEHTPRPDPPTDPPGPFGRRCRVRRADGEELWIEERSTILPDVSAYELDDAGPDGPISLIEMIDVSVFVREAQHRQVRERAAELVASVSQAVLAGEHAEDTYQKVAAGIAHVLDAAHVALVVPVADGRYAVTAGFGPMATALREGDLAVDPAFAAEVASLDHAAMLTPPAEGARRFPGSAGPLAGVRFASGTTGDGAITVMRQPGSAEFTDLELEVLTEVGQQLALAVALGAERIDRQRLALLEDRQRIATRLHDTVVQDLVASGMVLDAHMRATPPDSPAVRAVLDQINATVVRLRQFVFDLAAQHAIDELTEQDRP